MRIKGRCHCGNITFTLDGAPEPPEHIPARACDCSFCQRHGGVWTSCPGGSLEVTLHDPERVNAYEFGTKTAQFHVCSICGVPPVVTSRIDGHLYAVVNVNCLDGLNPARLERKSASFEGEAVQDRLERRKRGWIGRVSFLQSP